MSTESEIKFISNLLFSRRMRWLVCEDQFCVCCDAKHSILVSTLIRKNQTNNLWPQVLTHEKCCEEEALNRSHETTGSGRGSQTWLSGEAQTWKVSQIIDRRQHTFAHNLIKVCITFDAFECEENFCQKFFVLSLVWFLTNGKRDIRINHFLWSAFCECERIEVLFDSCFPFRKVWNKKWETSQTKQLFARNSILCLCIAIQYTEYLVQKFV